MRTFATETTQGMIDLLVNSSCAYGISKVNWMSVQMMLKVTRTCTQNTVSRSTIHVLYWNFYQ